MTRHLVRTLAILSTLTLCACKAQPQPRMSGGMPQTMGGPMMAGPQMSGSQLGGPQMGGPQMPGAQMAGPQVNYGVRPVGYNAPLPHCSYDGCTACAGCAVPGCKPQDDELLCDGGDAEGRVIVSHDFSVRGLNIEDTVVHYDCLDGRTLVQPSNRVCIYAPRFASVRKIDSPYSDDQYDQVGGVVLPVKVALNDERLGPTTALQPLSPIGQIGIDQGVIYRERLKPEAVDDRIKLVSIHDIIAPYADYLIIKAGIYEQAEKPRLAKAVQAAITWTHDHAVAVILDTKKAVVETGDQRAEVTFRVDEPPCPRLRVCKVASTDSAQPGEIVDFTIRFDNLGTKPIGNVTIIDNLTTRLEYVPDTALTSRKAAFYTQKNEADSLVLRWELTEPLPPGQGGVVRFKAKVR